MEENKKKRPNCGQAKRAEWYMGIESYSIHSASEDMPRNQMSVDFVLLGKTMKPQDYQSIFNRLQEVCKEFNSANQRENA